MPKIIFTSRYIKNPASSNAGKLIKYMGTREGVEKLPNGINNSPATKTQNDLICTALKTVPEAWDYPEMKSYLENKTKSNAPEFLNEFLERNADRIGGVKKLVSYYAERPGVEKLGKHGLFSQTDDKINLDEVAEEVSNHNGIVWTHVISLKREDAERLGYNNANAWKSLIRRNALEIAKAHKIEPSDLRTGEALGLLNSDIDLENRVMHLNRGVKEISKRDGVTAEKGREVKVGKLKSATSKRDVPLNDTAIEMILDLRKEFYLGDNSPLIPDENGNFTRPVNFRKRYYRILKAAGIETKGLHSLRHTFATNLVKGIKQADGSGSRLARTYNL